VAGDASDSAGVKNARIGLESFHRIGDNGRMARKPKAQPQKTGLYHAREARGMSRTELVKRSGVSKQQLSRLENGLIRLRLDHLKPFANALGYSPEQILLWGKYPGTGGDQIESEGLRVTEQVPELASPSDSAADKSKLRKRKEGSHVDRIKPDGWVFPANFVREQLQASPKQLLVVEAGGDSMAPTIMPGERVIVDTGHKTPSPDGLYAIRDSFDNVIIRRLQLLRAARPSRVKIISDNLKHAAEEVALSELEIVGKALCCLKLL
jgi:transcriptional regulator with XRE-family HTH domain